MSAVITTNPADFAKRTQEYFNPKLMEATQENLVLATYGERKKFPAHGTTIRFFRPRPANTTGTGAISEGSKSGTLTEVAVGYVDVALSQRGGLASISDIVQATDLLDTIALYTKTMGADAALDLDTVVRNALVAALKDSDTKYTSAYFERFAGVTNTGDSSADFATFNALEAANAKITRARHLGMITQLKNAKVKTIGGKYVAITPPTVIHDVRLDETWVKAVTSVDTPALYKGGQIQLDGCVFVEATNPWIEGSTYGTYSATGDNYGVIYLGEGAFGVPELSNGRAGGSPMGPRMNILASADKTDPQNTTTLIAWKCFYGCGALIVKGNDGNVPSWEVPRYGILRVKSTWV